ncbi:MAG: sensor histidine kinase, partial [Oligoflexales bacterium]|nr:sensor histidine kinase [Oligoflexales bacterium]
MEIIHGNFGKSAAATVIACGFLYISYGIFHNRIITEDSPANPLKPVLLSSKVEKYDLGGSLEYLEDPKGILSIDDAASPINSDFWSISKWDTPNFGLTESVYWLRLTMKNDDNRDSEWLLELGNPTIEEIEFYYRRPDASFEIKKTGSILPFSSREFDDSNFLFKTNVPMGSTAQFYIKAKSTNPMILPLTLYPFDSYLNLKNFKDHLNFLVFGMTTVMCVYSIILFASMKKLSYVYYMMHLISILVVQFSASGYSSRYFFTESNYLSTFLNPFFLSSSIFWLFLFSLDFLDIKKFSPRLFKYSMLFVIASALVMGVSISSLNRETMIYTAVLLIGSFSFLLLIGMYAFFYGNRTAKFYLFAFCPFLLGGICTALWLLAAVPSSIIFKYGYQLGLIIELIFLSISLSDIFLQVIKNSKYRVNDLKTSLENLKSSIETRVNQQISDMVTENEMIKKIYEQKVLFFQNVSHEFKTPLTL